MVENELSKLSEKVKLISTKGLIKDLMNGYSICNGAKYLIKDGPQNCIIFQPFLKYFYASRITVNVRIMVWKSKGLSDESIKLLATPDNSLKSKLYYSNKP